MLLQELFDSKLLLALPFVKDKQSICSGVALRRMLIILMLFISGNVHPNPGPANLVTAQLSFGEFCDRKSLVFLHVNICSLLNSKHFKNIGAHS